MPHNTTINALNNALQILRSVRSGAVPVEQGLLDVERLVRSAHQKLTAQKIYLDDERPLPYSFKREGYRLVRSGEVLIEWLQILGLENISHISFDHDLGAHVVTGYDVLQWIEERVRVHGDPAPIMTVHTDILVDRQRIQAMIDGIARLTLLRGDTT